MSQRASAELAVEEALAQARGALGTGTPVLAIAYGGVAHEQQGLHRALRQRLGDVPLVGCSTQGATVTGRCVEAERLVAVALLAGDQLRVRTAAVDDIRGDSRAMGRELAAQLGPRDDTPSVTLLYYDPLGGADAEAMLRGLGDGGYPLVYGGASGQPWGRMVETAQYASDRVLIHGAVAVRIDGLVPVADLTHGAESTGLEVSVTRVRGNVVLELDHRPALDVWCEQLGVRPDHTVENTSNWALGVRPEAGTHYEGLVTRAPFKLDTDERAIILQAPVAEGSRVQVCIRTQSAVYDGAVRMSQRLGTALAGRRPVLALGFECGARPGPFLGADLAHDEIAAMLTHLPSGVPWLGMYAWGELAPVGERSEFHNFTFPLCYLCEP